MKYLAVLALVVGCGRVNFEPLADVGVEVVAPRCGSEASLVACFHFDTDTRDSSPFGHDAIGDVELEPGYIGKAARFGSGVDLRIPDTAAMDFTAAVTVMAWIWLEPSAVGRSVIVDRQEGFSLYVRNQSILGATLLLDSSETVESGSAISASSWTHVAISFDGATARLYVGGQEVAQLTSSGMLSASDTSGTRIGGDLPSLGELDGLIDELGIWSEALSVQRIACSADGTC